AVRMKCQTQVSVDEISRRCIRDHVRRQALLAVTAGGKEVELAVLFTHQHVGASDVGTASKVKADKGDLACALGSDTTSVARCRYVAGQCRFGLTGVGKQAEHRAAEHRTETRLEALGDKFAPGDRSP